MALRQKLAVQKGKKDRNILSEVFLSIGGPGHRIQIVVPDSPIQRPTLVYEVRQCRSIGDPALLPPMEVKGVARSTSHHILYQSFSCKDTYQLKVMIAEGLIRIWLYPSLGAETLASVEYSQMPYIRSTKTAIKHDRYHEYATHGAFFSNQTPLQCARFRDKSATPHKFCTSHKNFMHKNVKVKQN